MSYIAFQRVNNSSVVVPLLPTYNCLLNLLSKYNLQQNHPNQHNSLRISVPKLTLVFCKKVLPALLPDGAHEITQTVCL